MVACDEYKLFYIIYSLIGYCTIDTKVHLDFLVFTDFTLLRRPFLAVIVD